MPTGQPWQKAGKLVSPAEHRYLMTVIATASNPRLLGRAGSTSTGRARRTPSTRCATCRPQHPDAELFFITGADALEQILSWKDADELFGLAHFVGVTRPGYELSDDHLPAGRGQPGRGARRWRSRPAPAASGCAPGEPVWYLVPDGVVQYIGKHRLYRGTGQSENRGRIARPAEME